MHPYSQHRAVRGRLRRTSYMLSVLLIGGFTAICGTSTRDDFARANEDVLIRWST